MNFVLFIINNIVNNCNIFNCTCTYCMFNTYHFFSSIYFSHIYACSRSTYKHCSLLFYSLCRLNYIIIEVDQFQFIMILDSKAKIMYNICGKCVKYTGYHCYFSRTWTYRMHVNLSIYPISSNFDLNLILTDNYSEVQLYIDFMSMYTLNTATFGLTYIFIK